MGPAKAGQLARKLSIDQIAEETELSVQVAQAQIEMNIMRWKQCKYGCRQKLKCALQQNAVNIVSLLQPQL